MNLPIILTLIRLVLVPTFACVYYLPFERAKLYAAIIFALAAVTDMLDGYLARQWKQTSSFGAFLDPVADKLLVIAALLIVVHEAKHIWMVFIAGIIISREFIVSALREWLAILGSKIKIKVKEIAKVKTFMQMLGLFLLILSPDTKYHLIYQVGWLVLVISSILTVWSFYCYCKVVKSDLTLG